MPRLGHIKRMQKRQRTKRKLDWETREKIIDTIIHDLDEKKSPRNQLGITLRKGSSRWRMSSNPNSVMKEESDKKGLMGRVLPSKMLMKLLHSRAAQVISALVGLGVGKIVSTGFLEKIQANEGLSQFLTDVGLPPTEAGITGLATMIAWAIYNLVMTNMYGNKFKEIQEANGLAPDRWPGPKTMAATTHNLQPK